VFIAVNKINRSVLKNLSVLSRMEWIWRWKVGMRRKISRKKYKKFVMTIHDFSPFVNFENGFIALVWIKWISLCWKMYPVTTGRIIFVGEITNVFNIFQIVFESCSPSKVFKFIIITLYTLFCNLILFSGRYFVQFVFGECLFFVRVFKLSAERIVG